MAGKLVPFALAAVAGVISVQYTLGPELERQAREREALTRREAGVSANVIETPKLHAEPEKAKSEASDQERTAQNQKPST